MTKTRLTPHQRDVLRELIQRSFPPSAHETDEPRWIDARVIGSRVALSHLVDKGYAERRVEHGPRGGEHPFYRPRGGR